MVLPPPRSLRSSIWLPLAQALAAVARLVVLELIAVSARVGAPALSHASRLCWHT